MSKRSRSGVETIKSNVQLTTLTFVIRSNATGSIANCSDMKATISGTSPGLFTVTLDDTYQQLEGVSAPSLITPYDANADEERYHLTLKSATGSSMVFRITSGSAAGAGRTLINPPTSAALTGSVIVAYRDSARTV